MRATAPTFGCIALARTHSHPVSLRWSRYARWFRTYRPGVLWGGVGNLFQDNHIADAPHNAFLGGGNEAVCASDDAICGGNDNLFEGNLVEHVCYETDDSGAFCECRVAFLHCCQPRPVRVDGFL
jgi:hypothetical protein